MPTEIVEFLRALGNLKDAATVFQAVATVLGILLAGLWTVYNFGISRVRAPKVDLNLDLKSVVETQNGRVAVISLEIRNTGRTKVEKRQALLEIHPLSVEENWISLTRVNTPLTYQDEIHEVFVSHSYLEPGERYYEEVGFVVADNDFLQTGLLFMGSDKYQTWEANCLFDITLAKTEETD